MTATLRNFFLLASFSSAFAQISGTPFYPSQPGMHFGIGGSVSVSGNEALVGGPYYPDGAQQPELLVHLFEKTGNNTVTQMATFNPDDLLPADGFGPSSINGNFIAIGAPQQDQGFTDAGSLYLYQRNGAQWNFFEKITAPDAAANDRFGMPKFMGNFLFVGASGDQSSSASESPHTGAVYVYYFDGTAWNFQLKLLVENSVNLSMLDVDDDRLVCVEYLSTTQVRFHSFALNTNTLALEGSSAILEKNIYDGFSYEDGVIYMIESDNWPSGQQVKTFSLNGNAWTQGVSYPVVNLTDQRYVGVYVYQNDMYLSANADYILLAERNWQVLHYKKNNGDWVYQDYYIGTGNSGDDGFGSGIARDGNSLVIGAPYQGVLNTGMAYFIDASLATAETPKNTSFVIYPNPVQDKLYFKNNGIASIAKVDIFAADGKQIRSFDSDLEEISLAGFDRGMYLLKITADDGTIGYHKILKK
ncbi:T9SS type A sorting domain-containing protein [Flavobacterium sp. MAH-1]|uniref:T9SS type A sorting domain-containing protein n=1 Tax=Flavobacterium agri TaxID=2743471 RepID=A0A7Y8XYN4_9FLAO|nr:T9SS type A sorting domain-containing protein [Flavobacterium agri]NUY79345.1 T9SS type A sorting domain-containing protein [Flavobacterium agri]NYA69369.1 T9SS type A sorting domain-containing protein [Flavobacterium agri]